MPQGSISDCPMCLFLAIWGFGCVFKCLLDSLRDILNDFVNKVEFRTLLSHCSSLRDDMVGCPCLSVHQRCNFAVVNVVFDPMFHGPQGTGPITRIVSFDTNDSGNRTVEFRLTGNVVRINN